MFEIAVQMYAVQISGCAGKIPGGAAPLERSLATSLSFLNGFFCILMEI